MDSISDSVKSVQDESLGFFNYVFNFDDENKKRIMNMLQYTLLSIIPVLLILRGIKHLIPEDDESKGSFEILAESIGQVILIMLAIWITNKIINYIPTYSGEDYPKFNEISFVLPFILILATMQTKLGAKINILVDRVNEVWDGSRGQPSQQCNNVRTRQPIAQTHQASRGDTLDSQLIPPPAQMMNQNISNNTTMINNLPNLNNMEQDNSRYGNDVVNLALDCDNEPMAANGLLGGAFGGSSW